MKLQWNVFLPCLAVLFLLGCQDSAESPQTTSESESGDSSAASMDETGDAPAFQETSDDTADTPANPAELVIGEDASSLLAPGSAAPTLDLAAVVHGPDVRPFNGDHVVVVEFWATWCGPCIANMPHLSSLQEEYGSKVQFIGVTDEEEAPVVEFLARATKDGPTWGEAIGYTLGLDRDQHTGEAFMLAAGQNGIPCAFIVDRSGKIAWIGHPGEIDEPLAAVVGGTWDVGAAREAFLSTTVPLSPPEAPQLSMPTLGPGMPAPAVQLASVEHGDPFDGTFEQGKAYVIEFWATWCGPCVQSMPHMSQLQQQHGDSVRFVGVTAEDADTVNSFLNQTKGGSKWSEILKYSIALDDDRATNDNYMAAAAQQGIPCAFLVDQSGTLAWIGHPMQLEAPLQQVVDGTFDVERAAKLFHAEHEIRAAIEQRDLEGALELLADLTQSQTDVLQFQLIELQLLSQLGRNAEYCEAAAKVVESNGDNVGLLNGIAWEIAALQKGDGRDLDLAMRIAMMASEATDHGNASVLDTVARVHYEQGDLAQAIDWQEQAVEAASSLRPQMAAPLVQTLEKYQQELADSAPEPAEDSTDEKEASSSDDTAASDDESAPGDDEAAATDDETAASGDEDSE